VNEKKAVTDDLETEGATPGRNPNLSEIPKIEAEKPLVILKPNFLLYWVALLFVLYVTLFFIIAVIIPVIMTGDYASVWPASDKRTGVKIMFFYMAWVWILGIPYFIPIFNRKKICFYQDRVEVDPYLYRKTIIKYSAMKVDVYGDYRFTISRNLTEPVNKPFQYLRFKFIESITFSQRKPNMYNHGHIIKVLTILKERVSDYNVKPLS